MTFANNSQKYSYAASFGFACFPEGLKKEYIDRLSSFHCISVREESAKFMLEAEGLHSRVDVDPTLLLDAAEWKEFSATINGEDKYILVYTVQAPLRLLDKAKELSAKTGFPIIYLNNEHRSNRELKHVRYSTPEEFVGWFANAEYVFTNSFHGTAFSVIFSKKFKVEIETRNSINYRSRDFVVGLGLEKSILYQDDPLEFDYNWVNTEEILEGKRRNSLLYLESIGKGTGSES